MNKMIDEKRIKAKVLETFKDHYPNTDKNFREHMLCFVEFCVSETIKEIENDKK